MKIKSIVFGTIIYCIFSLSSVFMKFASSQANLFQGKIAKLKGFVPPIELQNEFIEFVQQVDKSKVIEINTMPKGGIFNGNEFFVSGRKKRI